MASVFSLKTVLNELSCWCLYRLGCCARDWTTRATSATGATAAGRRSAAAITMNCGVSIPPPLQHSTRSPFSLFSTARTHTLCMLVLNRSIVSSVKNNLSNWLLIFAVGPEGSSHVCSQWKQAPAVQKQLHDTNWVRQLSVVCFQTHKPEWHVGSVTAASHCWMQAEVYDLKAILDNSNNNLLLFYCQQSLTLSLFGASTHHWQSAPCQCCCCCW